MVLPANVQVHHEQERVQKCKRDHEGVRFGWSDEEVEEKIIAGRGPDRNVDEQQPQADR